MDYGPGAEFFILPSLIGSSSVKTQKRQRLALFGKNFRTAAYTGGQGLKAIPPKRESSPSMVMTRDLLIFLALGAAVPGSTRDN